MGADIHIQKRTKTDLRQSEAQLRVIFESATIGIALTDLEGRPIRCNPAFEMLLGYTEAELCQMTFPQFTHPDDVQADWDLFRSLVSGQRDHYEIEKRYIRKDGQVVWGRLIVSLAQPPPGEASFAVRMVEDITAQKAAQEALRESEERFFKAFHGNLNPTVISRRADGRILEANHAFCEWFGVSLEEARKRSTFELGIWKSNTERDEFLRLLRQQGSVRNYQMQIDLPSGEKRITLLTVQPIALRNDDCLLTISMDITRQKEAERALQKSEERLRSGLEAARMGTWEWDIASGTVSWTEGVASLFGLAPGAFAGTLEAFFDLVDVEDRERAQRELYETIADPKRKYYSELRARWPDGSLHWLEGRGEVNRDSSGKAVTMSGTVVDVTERKQAESALRTSEERLRATIENTPDVAIQWYDEQGRVLFWNAASESVFGWKAGEAIGQTIDQLILDADQATGFKGALREVQRTGRPVAPTEFAFRRRDGSPGICVSTLFRIPNVGETFLLVCMDVDITERKRAEQQAREAQQRELRAREKFTRQLLNAEEQERQRLAAELHDGLGQTLSLIKNNAHLALGQADLGRGTIVHLNAVSQCVSEAIAEVRNLVRNLRPLQLEQNGLTDSIRELVEKVEQSTPVHMEVRIEDVDEVIRGKSAMHLYRIVQEALNNLIKHAGADRAQFTLERDIKCVRLRLADNGRGFEVSQIPQQAGLGLKNMSERAQMLGGFLEIKSEPDSGTRLLVELPIQDAMQ
jgi:PAS domain S-box-containing protein